MKRYVYFSLIIVLISMISLLIWENSPRLRLGRIEKIYREVNHPDWSQRVRYFSGISPAGGSGGGFYFWLVDVRSVSIPLSEAIHYYESESDRVGLRECHVNTFNNLEDTIKNISDISWSQFSGHKHLIIAQKVHSDSTIKR